MIEYLKDPSMPKRSEWVFFPPGLFSSSLLYFSALNIDHCIMNQARTAQDKPGKPIFLFDSLCYPELCDLRKGTPSPTIFNGEHLQVKD